VASYTIQIVFYILYYIYIDTHFWQSSACLPVKDFSYCKTLNYGLVWQEKKKISYPSSLIQKNNQLQNILTLYHINNFLLLFKYKKLLQ